MKNTKNVEKFEYGFGQHLIIDGYGANREKLTDLDFIYNFLSNYPEEIEMTKIMPPYVFKYYAPVPEDWGISGFVIIAESHISIHTFPEKLYLSVDVFSCKPFNADKAIKDITQIFEIKKSEIKFFDRGLEFPRSIRAVENYIRMERKDLIL
ncbi:MAG: adenosylmethionine decarboxylase [Thermodesulfobacterium sp.]|nr:adenosylmethionine decarboxylase [Thermodesulfobacterium sp.]